MFPVSGAAVPNTTGADRYRPSISLSRASLSWPKPGPPSSRSRNSAHRPQSLTCCFSGSARALAFGLREYAAPGKTRSSGSTSVRQNSSTQLSCCWNSGSVEKSHATRSSEDGGRYSGGQAIGIVQGGGVAQAHGAANPPPDPADQLWSRGRLRVPEPGDDPQFLRVAGGVVDSLRVIDREEVVLVAVHDQQRDRCDQRGRVVGRQRHGVPLAVAHPGLQDRLG